MKFAIATMALLSMLGCNAGGTKLTDEEKKDLQFARDLRIENDQAKEAELNRQRMRNHAGDVMHGQPNAPALTDAEQIAKNGSSQINHGNH